MAKQELPAVGVTAGRCRAPALCASVNTDGAGGLRPYFKAIRYLARFRLLSPITCHEGGRACVCDLTAAFEPTASPIRHHLNVPKRVGLIDQVAGVRHVHPAQLPFGLGRGFPQGRCGARQRRQVSDKALQEWGGFAVRRGHPPRRHLRRAHLAPHHRRPADGDVMGHHQVRRLGVRPGTVLRSARGEGWRRFGACPAPVVAQQPHPLGCARYSFVRGAGGGTARSPADAAHRTLTDRPDLPPRPARSAGGHEIVPYGASTSGNVIEVAPGCSPGMRTPRRRDERSHAMVFVSSSSEIEFGDGGLPEFDESCPRRRSNSSARSAGARTCAVKATIQTGPLPSPMLNSHNRWFAVRFLNVIFGA
jgi:ArsR family transcriptional regulator